MFETWMTANFYPSFMDKNKYCWRPAETCSPIRCPVLLVAAWAKNITSIAHNFVIPTAHGSRMCRGEVQRTWKVHSGVCVFYIFKVTPDTGSPPFGFDQVWLFPDPSFRPSGSRSQILTITLIQLFCNSDSPFGSRAHKASMSPTIQLCLSKASAYQTQQKGCGWLRPMPALSHLSLMPSPIPSCTWWSRYRLWSMMENTGQTKPTAFSQDLFRSGY